jgi:hypothetical protein
MANNLTALAPSLYSVAQQVSAEPFGLISAISTDFDSKGVTLGDSVKVPIAPTRSVKSFTPGAAPAAGDDATAEAISVEITDSDYVDWVLTGWQLESLRNGGNDQEWVRQLIAQGMRSLRNKAEATAWRAAKAGASFAFGTAGTTPFASDLTALTGARKLLVDNGAPLADPQLVVDTAAGLNIRNLGVYQNAYQAGSDAERRTGNFLPQFGINIRESAGVGLHTAGTGASYLVNGALAARDRVVSLDTGSGTILSGDVLTFGSNTRKHVVNAALAAGSLTLGRPGVLAAVADNTAATVGASYTGNLLFERAAIVGVMRPPAIPASPIIQQMPISDDKGMTYLLLEIVLYGQIKWELHLASGFKVVQGEHVGILLG